MTKNALIIFTRNPELGKCKTRLAKVLGNQAALDIYNYLLQHTTNITKKVNVERYVFYSETINNHDIWDNDYFQKKLQKGSGLGARMYNAFKMLFDSGYQNIIIIGSDLLDLNEELIENAFLKLQTNDAVIGPAKDGGYYLLGLKQPNSSVFQIENWGTETVYEQTLSKLEGKSVYVLKPLNDIDHVEDLKPYKVFENYFKHN
ncbi:TIGR04282 family arsenosugar biosynthesis glycosyltransferase [uncultured Psychroserpens sp.]|uniref:TIGR04282 family arsenosugar biosynthesis glycosyltransferase n=1 Tax=uncultured Psychroserpens sp. TaxID=255436 RepID=UPI00260D5941|nr:TIGR04282 family arsenosugar biosynthesis glycosyltransferase [uncultured Psychroserpens sp.]